jgi:predicted metal-dependent hydrolase
MDPRFQQAVREFNEGHFFEAHELWEAVWGDLLGEDRDAVRALVQVAAGYHKFEIGNRRGACKLLGAALTRLRRLPPAAYGLDMAAFVLRVEGDLKVLSAPGSADDVDLPHGWPPRLVPRG